MTATHEKRTHYRRDGQLVPYDYFEKRGHADTDEVDVIGWGTYGRSSVLAGQASKQFITTFDSAEEAEAVYGSMNWNSKYLEPSVSVAHLPGEDDPVPGGMYPDDIGGGRNDW
jgi:hypothetical protein